MTGVSVFGLGKLGAPLAALLAASGHEVIGVDANPDVVATVNAGYPPVVEPGLADVWEAARSRLTATTDAVSAAAATDVSMIIVPTPSEPSGAFSNAMVLQAIGQIGTAVRTKAAGHCVAVVSTVMPGSMDGVIAPALAHAAGRPVGDRLGLCYNPEFVALGSVLRDMRQPDFVLIGQSDGHAGDAIEALLHSFMTEPAPVVRASFVNAELAKISVNSYVTSKLSMANTLATLCQRLPGADVDAVTAVLGRDRRIGPTYLRGGLGFGGPCFPRDNRAFQHLAESLGLSAPIATATDRFNQDLNLRIAELATLRDGTVAVLGLAYKPDTAVTEASTALALARHLSATGRAVVAHDPQAVLPEPGTGIRQVSTVEDAVADADVIIIATPWPLYRTLALPGDGRRRLIVDCWRHMSEPPADADYVAFGVGPAAAEPGPMHK
jgi:UDPglucose 6-dehydrogenase